MKRFFLILLLLITCGFYESQVLTLIDSYTKENVNFLKIDYLPAGALVDGILYVKKGAYYYKRSVTSEINVKIFGADGSDNLDDTKAFQKALDVSDNLYIPAGNYYLNAEITRKIIIRGEGSYKTKLYAQNKNKAIFTYKNNAPYWTYNTEIKQIGFYSENKLGVAFTYGFTNWEDYSPTTQYYTNVGFENCYFFGFDKAIQRPTGNIGLDINKCGFSGNKYALYALNSKKNSEIMHAGNLTVNQCEFNSNEVCLYIHNVQDGFGAVSISNTVFEANACVSYIYNQLSMFIPVIYTNCWEEVNGKAYQNNSTTISIDNYINDVKSVQEIEKRVYIFDGTEGKYNFNSCRVGDVWLKGENIKVNVSNSVVENSPDYLGYSVKNTSKTNLFEFQNCQTTSGVPLGLNVFSKTLPEISQSQLLISSNQLFPKSRGFLGYPILKTVATVSSIPFDAVVTSQGTQSIAGVLSTTDALHSGLKSNQFTIPANNIQLMRPTTLYNTVANKYYLVTFDFKLVSGDLNFLVGNGTNQIAGLGDAKGELPLNEWYTFVGYGYSDAVSNDIGIWIYNKNSPSVIKLSNYQLYAFNTLSSLKAFLEKN